LGISGVRVVKPGSRVSISLESLSLSVIYLAQPFYTAEEIRSFRTLDLEPGLVKLC
jgi:hypothetical protein